MHQAGTTSLSAYRLFAQHLIELEQIYQQSWTRAEVYQQVKCDGRRGDLFFLWQSYGGFFDRQYFTQI